MQNRIMIIFAQSFIDKETIEQLISANSVTLAFIFGIVLVGAFIMLIRFVGSRSKGSDVALGEMADGFAASQKKIEKLEAKIETMQTKESERDNRWTEIVQNNTASQTQFAEAMNHFADKNAEWRKEQVNLQQTTIDRLDALNLNFITWPKSATETAQQVAHELKELQTKVEQLPQEVVEALRPVLKEFQIEIEQAMVRFKSEPEITDALD